MPAKWFEEQPSNRNFLAPSGFKISLELFPGVDFFCQQASIPDISVGFTEVSTPFRGVPIASAGGITYGDLRLKFIIDEDLHNYQTIFKWIEKNNLAREYSDSGIEYSKGELLILNSNMKRNRIVYFTDLFPVSLTGVDFDVADRDVDYLTADVTLKFKEFKFN
jgi:hypothetical protein